MLVIFDCDGVLIDSEVIYCAVDAEALTGLGHPTSAADIARRFTGVTHREAWETISAEIGFEQPDDWLQGIAAECKRRLAEDLQPIAAAGDTVRTLKGRGVDLCVASSTRLDALRTNLGHAGLLELVDPHVFSASQVKRSKPAPDVFLHAAAQMGFDPGECLVVEDSVAGVTAARRAGMRVLGFIGGGHAYDGLTERLGEAGAFAVVSSLSDVLDHAR
ncbi:HAD family phosphatase [Devosia sp.]|uniref:HAD family hydrolase n=1 Tax=Devosia sp. TaxID=1871048 RepID=UPI003264366D